MVEGSRATGVAVVGLRWSLDPQLRLSLKGDAVLPGLRVPGSRVPVLGRSVWPGGPLVVS